MKENIYLIVSSRDYLNKHNWHASIWDYILGWGGGTYDGKVHASKILGLSLEGLFVSQV